MIKRGILSPKDWRSCRNAVTWLQTRTHNGAKLQIKMGTGGRGAGPKSLKLIRRWLLCPTWSRNRFNQLGEVEGWGAGLRCGRGLLARIILCF